jgi:hypothetical protein
MKRSWTIVVFLCLVAFYSSHAEEKSPMTMPISLTGSQLVAGSIALKRLGEDVKDANLERYSVTIEENAERFSVIFTPYQRPVDSTAGTLSIRRGVDSEFGPKVRYTISKQTQEVIGKQFYR